MVQQRIKGQESSCIVIADGKSMEFTDIQSTEFTQDTETKEEGYLGEGSNRYDEIYKGYSGKIDMHNSSPELFTFLEIIKDRAQRRTPGTVINIKTTLAYPSGERVRIIMNDAFFDASGIAFSGRDAYGSTSIPFKGSEYRVL